MAKKAKTLDDALNYIYRNYVKCTQSAALYAATQAKEDVNNKAMNCVEQYYASFEPSIYRRTDSLRHAIVKHLQKKVMPDDRMIIEAGVIYDANRLQQYVQGNPAYDGSQKWRPVEATYVIENFLQGIHPETDGSHIPGQVSYFECVAPPIPEDEMAKYLNSYSSTFDDNMISRYAQIAAKYLNKDV